MRKKMSTKKLELRRETIRQLTPDLLTKLAGGRFEAEFEEFKHCDECGDFCRCQGNCCAAMTGGYTFPGTS